MVADYIAPSVRYYLNGEASLHRWLPHLDEGSTSPTPDALGAAQQSTWRIHPRDQADVRGSAPLDGPALRQWLADVRTMAGGGDFWLAYTREYHGDPSGKLLRKLTDDGWIQSEQKFAGVRLFRGRVPPP